MLVGHQLPLMTVRAAAARTVIGNGCQRIPMCGWHSDVSARVRTSMKQGVWALHAGGRYNRKAYACENDTTTSDTFIRNCAMATQIASYLTDAIA